MNPRYYVIIVLKWTFYSWGQLLGPYKREVTTHEFFQAVGPFGRLANIRLLYI